MKKRLIDAEIVLNRYQEICNGTACMDCPFNKEGCAVEKLILESAVVDAEPVRHGHWDIYYNDNIPYTLKCSECGEYTIVNGKYCPNCGAKMDEANDD